MTAISQMIGPPRGPFPESRISAPFRNERITPEQVEEVTASFRRVEELLGRLFEDKREARERAE